MPVLQSAVDVDGPDYAANVARTEDLLKQLDVELARTRDGGGERYRQRHQQRGRLLVRDRIELLVDPASPFLELSSLAAWGTVFEVGASVVTGIGIVHGIECVIVANDPTVRGGTSNPYTWRKMLRALHIARLNRLPVINLVESGGADLPTQADLFVPAGQLFRDLTQLSAAGIPTVALVFGNSTAGGAYVPGMCDFTVMVADQAKVFLGGPPLVKMATGEVTTDEELGGARMHSSVSGLADYFARDEADAIRLGRQIVSRFNWRKLGPAPDAVVEPRYDPRELRGVPSADLRVPFDPNEVLARLLDGSEFDEYKPSYGTSLVTGWGQPARLPGRRAGQRPRRAVQRGVEEGSRVHHARQPGRHPAALPPQHHRVHRRDQLRAGRDHQGRRQADQHRGQQHGAPPLVVDGRLVRGGELRHVRTGLRPPLPVRLAQLTHRGDGPATARRRSLDRRARSGAGGRDVRSTRRPTPSAGPPSRNRSSASRSRSS